MIFRGSILFESVFLFNFKKIIGAIIVKNTSVPFRNIKAIFIQGGLNIICFFAKEFKGSVDLMQFKVWLLNKLFGKLVCCEF